MTEDPRWVVVLVSDRASPETLRRLAEEGFGDMVKYVVDLDREVIALGGELHADAEAVLLEEGSRQSDIWGANFYPWLPSGDRIDYTSLINIRPSAGNPGMEVMDPGIRQQIRRISERLLLPPGEILPGGGR